MIRRPRTTPRPAMTLQESLAAGKAWLSPQDQQFAMSLLKGFEVYGQWTEKQEHWAGVLVNRARNAYRVAHQKPAPVQEARDTQYGKLWELFMKACEGMKKAPIMRMKLDNGHILKIEKGEPNERYPDPSLWLNTGRGWVGRISRQGEFIGRRDADRETVEDTLASARAIRAFLADPAGVGRAYGHETGSCCFCGKGLTHPSSKQVGYGPDCAARWGLPHEYVEVVKAPSKKARAAQARGDEVEVSQAEASAYLRGKRS